MSEIPSSLSRWEPSRALKISFLVLAVVSMVTLFAAKIFEHTVIDRRRIESAMGAMELDEPAKAFTLKDHAGTNVSLESLRGKLVFLNFWATWCGPCREEMPSLGELARSIDPADVAFVAVSVDEGWADVDDFLGKQQVPYTVLLDPSKAVAHSYGTEQYPETFLIGRDGRVLYKFEGARDWSSMAAQRILERAGARRLMRPAGS